MNFITQAWSFGSANRGCPQQMETTRIVFLFNGFIALKRLAVSISAVEHGIKQLREINLTHHFFPANPA